MYATPSTPQMWGEITQASCLDEMVDLVELAHDLGHSEREFWIQVSTDAFRFFISIKDDGRFKVRYPNNVFEIGGKSMLADRFGEAMADGCLFSHVMERCDLGRLPPAIAKARAFIERRVAA